MNKTKFEYALSSFTTDQTKLLKYMLLISHFQNH